MNDPQVILQKATESAANCAVSLGHHGVDAVASAGSEQGLCLNIAGEKLVLLFDKHLKAFHKEVEEAYEAEINDEEKTMGIADPDRLEE